MESLKTQLYKQLVGFANAEISISEMNGWIGPRLQNAEDSAEEKLVRWFDSLNVGLFEYGDGEISEEELRDRSLAILAEIETVQMNLELTSIGDFEITGFSSVPSSSLKLTEDILSSVECG